MTTPNDGEDPAGSETTTTKRRYLTEEYRENLAEAVEDIDGVPEKMAIDLFLDDCEYFENQYEDEPPREVVQRNAFRQTVTKLRK